MRQLNINRRERSIEMVLDLSGEASLVEVKIRRYHGSDENGKKYLEIEGLETGRPWLNALFDLLARNGRLRISRELDPEIVLALG